jgi:hypothetical protein
MTLKTYKLTGPQFLDPGWMNRFRGGRQDGQVAEDGSVVVHGQSLRFSDAAERLAPGIKVKVWVSFDFICADAAEIEREEQAFREKAAKEAASAQAAKELRWEEGRRFNEDLVIPVKWQGASKMSSLACPRPLTVPGVTAHLLSTLCCSKLSTTDGCSARPATSCAPAARRPMARIGLANAMSNTVA